MLRVKLGEISKVFNGYAFKSSEYTNDGYQVIRIANVQDGYISNESPKYITLKNNFHERFILKENDLLISLTGNVGRVGLVIKENLPAVLNQRVAKIIVDTNKILVPYLFYFFRNPVVQSQLIANGKGIAQKNIGSTDIENLLILLPSLNEQKRIVSVLDQADELRRKRKQAMELLDEYVKAVFYDMFGDFKDNRFGWELTTLSKITRKITDGTHQSPKFAQEGIPFIFISNIVSNEIILDTKKFISEEEYYALTKNTSIEKYDILYTTVGSYGNPAIVKTDKKFCFQRHIAQIKPDHSKTNVYFLYAMLKSPSVKKQVDNKVKGIAQKTLNLADLKSLNVIVPPIDVQNTYAELVKYAEQTKQKMIEQSEEMDNQFHALMQKAFKGEL